MYADEELKDLAVRILQTVERKFNVEEAEVFIQDLSQLWGGTEFRMPKLFESINRVGCAIRFLKDNKMFFSCFSLASALEDIRNLSLSNFTGMPLSHFEFPVIDKNPSLDLKIFDPNIASQNEQILLDYSKQIAEITNQNKDFIIDSTILFTYERKIVLNTSYVMAFEKGTWFDLSLRVLYNSQNMVTSAESNLSTRQIPLSVNEVLDRTMNEAIQKASSSLISTTTKFLVPVIFSPQAFSDILSFGFVPLLRNRAKKDLESKEFDQSFTLVDDGTVPGLPNSTAIDDEGVPQSRTEVITRGHLVNLLNSSENIEIGEERTGNAFRVKQYELFPRNYQNYPQVYPSNLIISAGKEGIGEIIGAISEGILVNRIQGQMTADYKTGLFKVSSIDAYMIENGGIRGTLPSIAIVGNIFDILASSPIFSKDRQSVRPTLTPYSILSPYVVTDVVSIYP